MGYADEVRTEVLKALSRYTDSANLEKLARVRKTSLLKWLLNVAELAKPSRVFVWE